jgi:hypothetical protein
MFLLPGLIIAYYVAEREFESYQKSEMIRYLRSQQNGDGGWGLHIEGPSCIFGTCLTYISLRLLGVPASDKACLRSVLSICMFSLVLFSLKNRATEDWRS